MPLGVRLIKQFKHKTLHILLSLLMLFLLLNKSLICLIISINYTLLLYSVTLKDSFKRTLVTQFHSGTILVTTNGYLIYWLAKSQNITSVKIEKVGLGLFYFSFYFYFIFDFLFLEQLGLGLISHAVTTVTWWRSHKIDHET